MPTDDDALIDLSSPRSHPTSEATGPSDTLVLEARESSWSTQNIARLVAAGAALPVLLAVFFALQGVTTVVEGDAALGMTWMVWAVCTLFLSSIPVLALFGILDGFGAFEPLPIEIRLTPTRLEIGKRSLALDRLDRIVWDEALTLHRGDEAQTLPVYAAAAVQERLVSVVNERLARRGRPDEIPEDLHALRKEHVAEER